MWTRKDLKERAKAALSRNYWKAVLVSLVLILLGGISPATAAGGSSGNHDEQENEGMETTTIIIENEDAAVFGNAGTTAYTFTAAKEVVDEMDELLDESHQKLSEVDSVALVTFSIVFLAIVITIIVVIITFVILLDVFLGNPLCVGAQRFMLKSVEGTGNIAELGFAFDHSYKNAVKTTFIRDLHIFLWMLLFLIPGIYKKYQYYMVDYILAENPDMPYKEVLERSKKMMEGQKWNAFVLDLSFILWHMLGIVTCGLSEIFYVRPYIYLTRASLYTTLRTAAEGE